MGWNASGSMIAVAQNKIRVFRLSTSSSSYTFDVDKNELKSSDSSSYIDSLAWHPTSPDILAYITSKQAGYAVWDVREKQARKIQPKSSSSTAGAPSSI